MRRSKLLKIVFSYLTIYTVWGSTYLFIKIAVRTIPPLSMVGLRFLLGGILLLGFALAARRLTRPPAVGELKAAAFMALFLLVGGNVCVAAGEREVDSYLAALIIAAQPVVVAVMNGLFLGIRVSGMRLSGILTGILGVGLLLYDGRSLATSVNPHVLLLIASIFSWGVGTTFGHRMKLPPDVFVSTGTQMLMAAIVCLPAAWIFEPPPGSVIAGGSLASWLSLLFLATIGSFALATYNYLLKNEPAQRLTSYALVNPVIAVALGILVGGEKPVPYLAAGLPLILAGLVLLFYGDRLVGSLRGKR